MSTVEQMEKMFESIKHEDEKTLKGLYEVMKTYVVQRRLDKMIAEGEEDIASGNVYSLKEAKQILDNWEL